MLKLASKFYTKLVNLIYHKGYVIEFKTEKEPNFKKLSYLLNTIGSWITKQDKLWICTSSIKDKDEFVRKFSKITKIPEEEFTIEERYFPFVLKY
ncbi:DUF3884 family protein [Helcococcus kunzii]|uniref:DUF3884 family protein n=1 Tax=Helcococcus kunzii TaxID=40091 RepID=UPI0024AE4D01|nr:DUF3884 family protein [Helcococcus kunzii]